ncbi:MAG: threonine--tRNA ligase [Elusimicrobiota bacterium]|nr:threonine--tRNA ligase [Elusimicrobiota bacterium]
MEKHNIDLETLRHSASHIMAQAVLELFPDTKLAIGPAIEDGFYYDFDSPHTFTPEDLIKIEQKMKEIVKSNYKFIRKEMSVKEALEFFNSRQEKYKVEILREILKQNQLTYSNSIATIYQHGNFIDLCKGPHIESTGQLNHFKLLSVAGAYWRGEATREQLQRIYGTAFFTKEDLETYLTTLEEAKKRDHRKLGQQLDLFSVHDEVGSGLIHWHPKGALVRKIIEDFWTEQHLKSGYQIVYTPHIASEEIYKVSGHIEKYSDLMYSSMDIEGKPFRVKPMNCPNHIMIYKTKLHSYKEMPVRFAEMGTVYRFEKSGVLHGLLRVRGFTIDDAHIFCRKEQVEDEILSVFNFTIEFLKKFGFKDYRISLSTRPEKFVGEIEKWEIAIQSLKKVLEETGYEYYIDEGGGAFYGPKISIEIKDVLKRSWQCATIQFDFNLPERFNVTYRDTDGKDKQVVMIHRAILGSIERFFGILIEHYAGAFPLWLAPVQTVVMSISDKQKEYAEEIHNKLIRESIRCELDIRNETLNYKIREATLNKVPYIIIVGEKEQQNKNIALRTRTGKDLGRIDLKDFIAKVLEEISNKS